MKRTFSKSFVILYLYDKFLKETTIKKVDVLDELLITEQTFKRYVKDIRKYLKETNSIYVIEYDRKHDLYLLKKNVSKKKAP